MNDPELGAGIWLGAVLYRLRYPAGDRAPRLPDAAAMTRDMTDIVVQLRQFPWRADNWEVRADMVMLEAADEIERLQAVLRYISGLDDVDADEAPLLARRALEPKP